MQVSANRQTVRAFGAKAPRRCAVVVRATAEVAPAEVAAPKQERKLGPLERGGTLSGEAAAGKDAGIAAKAAIVGSVATFKYVNQIVDGKYRDDRWDPVQGRWILSHVTFQGQEGVDWDKVIDAEIARRKLLEDFPIPSINEEPVNFDTSEVPWTVWIKRFHLPEAEKLNGRAAMVGYLLAGLVDLVGGPGLVDQQESFLGKLALHICVFGILAVRSTADLEKYKNLIDEATFYDKQWNATWDGVKRPSEASEN